MSFKLELTDKFMESEHVPNVCLFSGRTEALNRKKMQFTYTPPSAQLGFLVGGALLMAVMSKRFDYAIPTAPKQRFLWGLRRNIWALPVFLIPALFCFVTIAFTEPSSNAPITAAGIGFVLGLITTIAGAIWAWVTQLSFKVKDLGVVQVSFPTRMQATYEAYKAGVEAFDQERAARRQARGLKAGASAGADEDEDWADEAGSKWDSGSAKK